MMTPVYLNPQSSPFSHVERANDQDQRLKLFISSSYNNQATASSCSSLISSFHTFFDSFDDQRAGSSTTTTLGHDHSLQYHHNTDKHMWDCGTSTYDQASSPSFLVQPHVVDVISTKDNRLMSAYADHERGAMSGQKFMEINGGGGEVGISNNNIRPRAVKWMSSKMRLMQKMTNPDLVPASTTENHILAAAEIAEHKFQVVQYQENSDETSFSRNSNNNTTTDVRVCSDCNTNTTPLWRSGPRGPKSLCNACGIRQRKVRRAMAEAAAAAANGFVVGATDTSSAKGKVANKEKKLRGSHSTNVTRCKNKSKLIVTDTASVSPNNKINSNNNKIYFKGLGFQRVFPQDVAEAAILLMELSCGLINHS